MAWLSSANPPPTKLALNPSRDWLDACMTTSAAAALFQTPLAQYAHAQTNEMRLRASHEPVFPEHIRDKIDFVGMSQDCIDCTSSSSSYRCYARACVCKCVYRWSEHTHAHVPSRACLQGSSGAGCCCRLLRHARRWRVVHQFPSMSSYHSSAA